MTYILWQNCLSLQYKFLILSINNLACIAVKTKTFKYKAGGVCTPKPWNPSQSNVNNPYNNSIPYVVTKNKF